MHLLQPRRKGHAALLSSLYGLLMLLPHSTAFHTLRDRLTSVTSLHIGLAMQPREAVQEAKGSGDNSAVVKRLVDVYNDSQRRRRETQLAQTASGNENGKNGAQLVQQSQPAAAGAGGS